LLANQLFHCNVPITKKERMHAKHTGGRAGKNFGVGSGSIPLAAFGIEAKEGDWGTNGKGKRAGKEKSKTIHEERRQDDYSGRLWLK